MADAKISALTNYSTPLDADVLPIVDTANTTTKKVTWANIKATLKTYFDALYEVPLTFSTGLTRTTNTITVNTTQNIAKLSNLTSNGFVKTSGGDGTLSVDTNTYYKSGDSPTFATITTTGSIELGNASDTTIARASAGVVSIEGNNIVVNTSSPTLGTITTTGNIELGNASDTTLSRSSAGVLAVEGVVIPSISSTNTLTNKRVTKRLSAVTQSATPTINTDNMDIASITGLAQAITSMSTNLSGTPQGGDLLMVQITDNGTARAITWGSSFASTTVTLPSTTVISTLLRTLLQWDATASKWQCIGTA